MKFHIDWGVKFKKENKTFQGTLPRVPLGILPVGPSRGPLWITKLMIKAAKFPVSYGWLWISSVPNQGYYKYNSFILPQASYINRTRLNLLLKSLRQRCCDSDLAKKRNLPSQTDCRDWRSTTAVRRLRPSSSNLSMSCFSIPQDLK